MAKRAAKKATRKRKGAGKKPIESYDHQDKKRANNPPVGLVTPATDPDEAGRQTYAYDPHLDPQLVWAGKAEHTSFMVPTVSLHVHERIDARTIIEATRKRNGGVAQASSLHGPSTKKSRQDACATYEQLPLFEQPGENLPLREAIEFYKHAKGWTNRLVAGDSLLVMNSLLEKEGMAGKVQMVYIDPPYGIRYGSNFQPFVNKRDVKDGKDEDLTQEPEMIRAFRDTWELGIHSYLSYLRDRLLLARELLHESGSCFVQISDENVHLVRGLLGEVFSPQNFVSQIAFQTTPYATSTYLAPVYDTLIWYAKDVKLLKYRQLFLPKEALKGISAYHYLESSDDQTTRTMTADELGDPSRIPTGWKRFQSTSLISQGATASTQDFEFEGRTWRPPANTHWKTTVDGLDKARMAARIFSTENSLRFKGFLSDFPISIIHNIWDDMITGSFTEPKRFVVQTNPRVIARCLLMATDPGDLVLDPTCGSGTTAYVAEQWGRRWITCDTSRVSIALAKQRLMTALYDYYELAHPDEGVGSGFKYKTVPHITLKSIANNPEIKEGMSRAEIDAAIAKYAGQETLYDQPFIDNKKARVSGPFTVEAVPAPAVMSIAEASEDASATVAQASSLPDTRATFDAEGNADKMSAVPQSEDADKMSALQPSALQRAELRSGTHDRGYLPHWKAEGATYFVTFRLAGTLPKGVLDAIEAERAEISERAAAGGRALSVAEEQQLSELRSERIDRYLDAGHGDCWLVRDEVATLVARALEQFAGERYDLHAWVIMPNHLHAVLTPLGTHTLSAILHSWKSFTATRANEVLNRKGKAFWQSESYDHLVRDERDYQRVCEYTVSNPVSAGLCARPEDCAYGSAGVAQASSLQDGITEDHEGRQDACATWTADGSVGRSGETLRQDEWRDELLKCGIRGKSGQRVEFSRVEALPGTRWLHADAETRDEGEELGRKRVVVSFGPEHAPLEQRQVEQALEEAQLLKPQPKMVVFASFQFDPEAAKDIDETKWPGITLLKVQMNTDLLTDDLKKKRASNESF